MKTKVSNSENRVIGKTMTMAYWSWIVITTVFILINGILYLLKGATVFQQLIQEGPISFTPLTLASVLVVWFGIGVALVLLLGSEFRARHAITVICTSLVLVLYTNILRERTQYGDIGDYLQAAHNLSNHVALNSRYLYPPFLATVIQPILPLGDTVITGIFWFANLVSLCLFFVLLTYTLKKYGFGTILAHLVALFFILINVPILRTLDYLQVNLHVVNMIFLALLIHKRMPILSALCLALAVQLKVSPIVLVLPFVLDRDWKWIAWFTGISIAITGITVLPFGWKPFLDFFINIRNIYAANGIAFRDSALDSFFRSTAQVFGYPLSNMFWLITISKICVLLAVVGVLVAVLRNKTFLRNNPGESHLYNSFPVLLILMLLASPIIWEHHAVFVSLPYLLALKRLNKPWEVVVFGFAYILEFLLPTFDFFPWSFGRLLSPLLILGILYIESKGSEDGFFWKKITTYLATRISTKTMLTRNEIDLRQE